MLIKLVNNCHTKQGKVIQTCNAEITRKSNKGVIRIFKRRKKIFQYSVILIYLTKLFNLYCFMDNSMKSVDITERIHFKFCKLFLISQQSTQFSGYMVSLVDSQR